MGWTTRVGNIPTDEMVAMETRSVTVVEKSMTTNYEGDVTYIAFRTATDDAVHAAVIVVERSGGWTSVKVMGEEAHPYYYEPSAAVLAALSPTHNARALEWREACAKEVTR